MMRMNIAVLFLLQCFVMVHVTKAYAPPNLPKSPSTFASKKEKTTSNDNKKKKNNDSSTIEVMPYKFPTRETPAYVVLEAQLEALQRDDLETTYRLFSRARRMFIKNAAKRDILERNPPPALIHQQIRDKLSKECPGLMGHRKARISTCLTDPMPTPDRLLEKIFLVRVDDDKEFYFTMTRQSEFDGGEPRDHDGFERCWFVWAIGAEENDNQSIHTQHHMLYNYG